MPISKARRESNDRYNAKCDAIQIRPIKADGERIREAARREGKSVQGYILDCIREHEERAEA